MGATALILIDIQKDCFPGGRMEIPGIERMAKKAQRLLKFFRRKKLPLFHVRYVETDPQGTCLLPGTDGIEIHESVKPLPGEVVIDKHFSNSFRDTDLLQRLKEAQVNELVICGVQSNVCIDATVRGASDYGFECTVIHDACAASDVQFLGKVVPARKVHAAFMGALASDYGKVISLKEWLQDK